MGNNGHTILGIEGAKQAEELAQILARYEVMANSSIKKLMVVNDVYGSAIMRQAVLDEINGHMREMRKWLTTTNSFGTSVDA